MSKLFPILSADGDDRDERFPGVVLVEFDDESKTTVEGFGSVFRVTDWEVYELDGQPHWFPRSFFTISQGVVDAIGALSGGAP